MNQFIPPVAHSVADQKQALRQEMKDRRESIESHSAKHAATAAAAHLLSFLEKVEQVSPGTGIVTLYAAVGSEISTEPAIKLLHKYGYLIALPRMSPGTNNLTFHRVTDQTELTPGAFQILEPSNDAPMVLSKQIDLFVVPGLAFSESGDRLGWGQGYYDTTLAQNTHGLRVGYAFEEQIIEKLPADSHDQPMNAIITECGIRFCE